jgi:hypothetical protein
VRAIAAASNRACAVTMTDGIVCWGRNDYGEGGTDPFTSNSLTSPVAVSDMTDTPLAGCADVAIVNDHSCAICGGVPVCWGQGSWGGLGRGPNTQTDHRAAPVTVPAGLTFTEVGVNEDGGCALTDRGRLFCWGLSIHGEAGTGASGRNVPTPIGPAG